MLLNSYRFNSAPPPAPAGQFLIGSNDEVWTSPDGVTWTSRTVSSGHWDEASRILAGTKILVTSYWGSDDTYQGQISSDNGVTWSDVTTPFAAYNLSMPAESAAGTLVMVGAPDSDQGAVTSTNGTTWTTRTTQSNEYVGVIRAESLGLFIAFAVNAGVNAIDTSPTGETWTPRTVAGATFINPGKRMAWSGTKAVITGLDNASGNIRIFSSTNGTSWSVSNPGLTESLNSMDHTIWDGTKFVALGRELLTGTPTDGLIITSADGVTWTESYITVGDNPFSLVWTGSVYAVLAGVNGDEIWTSPNLTTWTHVGDCPVADITPNRLNWIPAPP